MLVVFIDNPITKVLEEFLECFKCYQAGEVSEEVVNQAQKRYEYVTTIYKWRSD